MSGEEGRLFGVGTESRIDDQGDACLGGRRRHLIEGSADIGAHAVALAIDERTAVAASARRRCRRFIGRARRGGGFSNCRGFRLQFPFAELNPSVNHNFGLDRREGVDVGKGDAQARRRHAVGLSRSDRSNPCPREISDLLEVTRVGRAV